MAEDDVKDPEEMESANWETLTEEDEKYLEKLEHPDPEVIEDTEETERPEIDVEVANKVAQEEKKDMGPELGMRFHAFWVSFGLPLAVMWAGLDALTALLTLIQGNTNALANLLIRGAVLFFGIPALKGLRKFERQAFIKHLTLCFYSLAVKVVNLILVVMNIMAAPSFVANLYRENSEKYISEGVTEAMILGDLKMQFMLTAVLNIVTFVFWILVYRYYKKRRKYFRYSK